MSPSIMSAQSDPTEWPGLCPRRSDCDGLPCPSNPPLSVPKGRWADAACPALTRSSRRKLLDYLQETAPAFINGRILNW